MRSWGNEHPSTTMAEWIAGDEIETASVRSDGAPPFQTRLSASFDLIMLPVIAYSRYRTLTASRPARVPTHARIGDRSGDRRRSSLCRRRQGDEEGLRWWSHPAAQQWRDRTVIFYTLITYPGVGAGAPVRAETAPNQTNIISAGDQLATAGRS
jgi:hypothetical protein